MDQGGHNRGSITASVAVPLTLDHARIGIITALPKEAAAVQAVFQSAMRQCLGKGTLFPSKAGAAITYQLLGLPSVFGGRHVVAVTSMVLMGNNMAATCATNMIRDCPNIKHIVMVGIAGAVPSPRKPEEHVRLGDIVASDQHGVVQFDFGKDHEKSGFEYRGSSDRPSAALLEAAKRLQAMEEAGEWPWQAHIAEAVSLNPKWARPDEADDQLNDDGAVVAHPDDSEFRRPGQPRVFLGAIASSNVVLKNATRRDEIRDQHRVKAVEMEAAGVVEAAYLAGRHYFIVRGTCDYCNSTKNDKWQRYSVVAAAAYTRELLYQLPPDTQTQHLAVLPSEGDSSSFERVLSEGPSGRQQLQEPYTPQPHAPGTSQVQLPTVDHETLQTVAADFQTKIQAATQVFEHGEAFDLADKLKDWLGKHSGLISAQLESDLYVLLATVATTRARLNTPEGQTPNLSDARALLQRAEDALRR